MFSSRLPEFLTENALAQALAARRRSGSPLIDLTESNPTRVGLHYPERALAEAFASVELARYAPDPRGLLSAREAIAAVSDGRLEPERLFLTASTSEAYGFLFKLLCAPGDEVLVPQPSYPLFEHLTQLEGVVARPYRLHYHGRWAAELDELRRAVNRRTRAVLVVSPNNPTGSCCEAAELAGLAELCARGAPGGEPLALVGDEVFADYPLHEGSPAPSVLDQERALAFSLGGLSKSCGLPQMKLGWIALGGPAGLRDEAARRLEVICDSYLSVGTPVQLVAPRLLELGADIRVEILERISGNLARLVAAVGRHPACTLYRPEGGWTAVVRVPALRSEEGLALELVEQEGVVVHPGYFFDFAHEAYLVLSLLPDPRCFGDAVERVLRRACAL